MTHSQVIAAGQGAVRIRPWPICDFTGKTPTSQAKFACEVEGASLAATYGSYMLTHSYATRLVWGGSTAEGYRAYSRDHTGVTVPATQEFALSADPAYRGNRDLLNPEQLLVMAASSCQLLSFLAVAARQGVTVIGYTDDAQGWMAVADKPVRVGRIRLSPVIEVEGDVDPDEVVRMSEQAHEECFIANSLTTVMELDVTVMTQH